jgi:hypothetical protein
MIKLIVKKKPFMKFYNTCTIIIPKSYHLVRVSEVLACEHGLVAQFLFDSQYLVVLSKSF